ncbi:MAG: serine/threonine-protein kinase [Gemmatimonadaceae bacterium]
MMSDAPAAEQGPRPYLRPGTQLVERYTILREIGRGGYSAVYAARDETVRSLVAIKLLVPPPATAELTRERMRREVAVARQLSHPNIVAVHDFVDDGEHSFIVMRLIDGSTLADRVSERGPIGVDAAVRLLREISAALGAAHRCGVLHRDVKPQNILLDEQGDALLADFGSAHVAHATTLTRTGTVIGTVGYVSPNVAAGGRPDVRDDLYALGMTLVFALTGALPGRGPGDRAADRATGQGVRCSMYRPDVPWWLDDLLAALTAPDPRDRIPSSDRLLAAIDEAGTVIRHDVQLERCLVCDDVDALGNGICDLCAQAHDHDADTLVLVRGEDHAVARVPSAIGDAAVRRLREHGRDAFAVPERLAWTAIPKSTFGLALLVVISGVIAVRAGTVSMIWTPLMVAAGLLFVAERTLKRPRGAVLRANTLPASANDLAVSTLAVVRGGTARSLLTTLTAEVRALYRLQADHPDLAPVSSNVQELLAVCCRTARDIAEADQLLDRWESEPSDATPNDNALPERSAVARRREEQVQRMLEATAAIRAACQTALADEALALDLEARVRDVRRALEALREVHEVLAA